MAAIGTVKRLPFRTNNALLPVLVEYDTTDILSQILAHPTLRTFIDLSDSSKMTISSGLVSSVTTKGANVFTASAAGADRPTFTAAASGGQPAVTFNGAEKLNIVGLFSGGAKLSVSAAIHSTAPDTTSRMYLSTAAVNNGNFYAGGDQLRSHQNDVFLDVPSMRNRMVNVISTMDDDTDVLRLYSGALSSTGTLTRPKPTGDANIGAWNTAATTNRFIGHIGYIALFDEDLSGNATIRALLEEYTKRRWRTV